MAHDLDPITVTDDEDPDASRGRSDPGGSGSLSGLFRGLVLSLLVAIVVLLAANLAAIRALTTETKRSACYERLSFIGRPDERLVPGAARLCEGPSPVVEYSDR